MEHRRTGLPPNVVQSVELQVKLLPLTEKAGYSKIDFWHSDGPANGQPINGSTGVDGWGWYVKLEQELTCDGRLIAVGRYGRSYDDSAVFEKLGGAHLVLYDPFNSGRYKRMGFEADLFGLGADWGLQTGADRDETDISVLPISPVSRMDATFHYQAIFNPGNDITNDFGSAISLRLRSTF